MSTFKGWLHQYKIHIPILRIYKMFGPARQPLRHQLFFINTVNPTSKSPVAVRSLHTTTITTTTNTQQQPQQQRHNCHRRAGHDGVNTPAWFTVVGYRLNHAHRLLKMETPPGGEDRVVVGWWWCWGWGGRGGWDMRGRHGVSTSGSGNVGGVTCTPNCTPVL